MDCDKRERGDVWLTCFSFQWMKRKRRIGGGVQFMRVGDDRLGLIQRLVILMNMCIVDVGVYASILV